MSTIEYNDLFIKCQDTGIYHVFVFDVKNSRKITDRNYLQEKLMKLILLMYKELQEKEAKENKNILVKEEGFVNLLEAVDGFGYKQEPFIYGDAIGFTIYRNSLNNDEVISIFNKSKEKLNIDFDFHVADGYYETNNYEEGNIKYFRGYCIDLLCKFHKPYNEELRKILRK